MQITYDKTKMIERGNTQFGVNEFIVHYLAGQPQLKTLMDIPCGEGSLLRTLKNVLPSLQTSGVDLYSTPYPEIVDRFQKMSIDDWIETESRKFDVVSSVSGVMVHDQLTAFFRKCVSCLNDNGTLIVSNDNFLTMRDRFHFLFFGHVKRFKKVYTQDEGNWNMVPIQALWKLLKQNNFEIETIKYKAVYIEDWLLLPFALVLFPIHLLYILSLRSEMSFKQKYQLFPIWVFLARHYVIVAKKTSSRLPN